MNCQECNQRPATVHLTKIINNRKTEIHLCEECARKRNDFSVFNPFSINDILANLMDMGKPKIPVGKIEGSKCENCGMTYQQFKKLGRLGCKDCYTAFRNDLVPILRRIQGGTQHSGKFPNRVGKGIRIKREIEQLKEQLRICIKEEAFERAAELRDRIKELEKQL